MNDLPKNTTSSPKAAWIGGLTATVVAGLLALLCLHIANQKDDSGSLIFILAFFILAICAGIFAIITISLSVSRAIKERKSTTDDTPDKRSKRSLTTWAIFIGIIILLPFLIYIYYWDFYVK